MSEKSVYVVAVVRHKKGRGYVRFKTATGDFVANAFDKSVVTYEDLQSARLALVAINECVMRRAKSEE